jgi:hypothetical protein
MQQYFDPTRKIKMEDDLKKNENERQHLKKWMTSSKRNGNENGRRPTSSLKIPEKIKCS